VITPAQIRAARALLGWTQAELAAAAGLGVVAIKSFERGRSDPRSSTVSKMEQALDAAGIIFLHCHLWVSLSMSGAVVMLGSRGHG
jgi:transcriptional regulator with XRE-family HTH domain